MISRRPSWSRLSDSLVSSHVGSSSSRFICSFFSLALLKVPFFSLLILSHKRSLWLYVALWVNEVVVTLGLGLHWRVRGEFTS